MGSFMNKGKRGNTNKPFVKYKKTKEFLTAKAIRETISSMMSLEDIFFNAIIKEPSFIKAISQEEADIPSIVLDRLSKANIKSELNVDEYSLSLVLEKVLDVIVNFKDSENGTN